MSGPDLDPNVCKRHQQITKSAASSQRVKSVMKGNILVARWVILIPIFLFTAKIYVVNISWKSLLKILLMSKTTNVLLRNKI